MTSKTQWLNAHRMAQLGICAQFLALIRTLAEFFRLRHVLGADMPVAAITPYVGSALFTAVATGVAVLCYFAGHNRAAVGVAILTVLSLLAIKFAVIGV